MPCRNSLPFGPPDRGGITFAAGAPRGTKFARAVFPHKTRRGFGRGKSCNSPRHDAAPAGARARSRPHGRALLVRPGHQAERRARSRGRRFQAAGSQAHRRVVETLGGTKPPPQGRALPVGVVDAGVLHQPRRQEFACQPTPHAGKSQDRTAPAVRARVAARLAFSGAMAAAPATRLHQAARPRP